MAQPTTAAPSADLAVRPPFLAGLDRFRPADPDAVRPADDEVADLRALLSAVLAAHAASLPVAPRTAPAPLAPASPACAAFGMLVGDGDIALSWPVRRGATPGLATPGLALAAAVGAAREVGRRPRGEDVDSEPIVLVVAAAQELDSATGQAALTAACRWAALDVDLPLLIVVDDTAPERPGVPAGWTRSQVDGRLGLEFVTAVAADPLGLSAASRWAVTTVRTRRCPVAVQLTAPPSADPLALAVRALVRRAVLDVDDVEGLWREAVLTAAASREPGADQAAPGEEELAVHASTAASEQARAAAFGQGLPETGGGLTLAASTAATLLDAGAARPRLTAADAAGPDDPLTCVALARGSALAGAVPVLSLPGPAPLAGAVPVLAGRGAGLVLRVPVAAGQAVAWSALREADGVRVACPAHPSDAPGLLRTAVAAAAHGAVTVLLEPLELADAVDMVEPGDGAWTAPYPPPPLWRLAHVPVGRSARWGSGADVTVVTAGAGVRTALRAGAGAGARAGVRVVDLRWLAPLPVDDVVREASATGRLLVLEPFDGPVGVAEALLAAVLDAGFAGRVSRLPASAGVAEVRAAITGLMG